MGAVAVLSAQTGGLPEFEAVEVRVAQPLAGGAQVVYATGAAGQLAQILIRGDQVTRTEVFSRSGQVIMRYASLRQLITTAYKEIISEDYLTGGPSWIDAEHFDLVAKAPPETPVDTARLMMQDALAKRFHLQVHRESKPMPIYALVEARSGSKLRAAEKASDPGVCRPAHGSASEAMHRNCRNITMAAFAAQLPKMAPSYVDRPVLDFTGLDGRYDLDLAWSPVMPGADGLAGNTIFSALEKELGLKLEPRKHPMPVIVIDHVDHLVL